MRIIAEQVGDADGPVICGLARANEADITACIEAIAPPVRKRVRFMDPPPILPAGASPTHSAPSSAFR